MDWAFHHFVQADLELLEPQPPKQLEFQMGFQANSASIFMWGMTPSSSFLQGRHFTWVYFDHSSFIHSFIHSFIRGRVSLCSPSGLWTHRDAPVSASQVLGSKVCATTAQLSFLSYLSIPVLSLLHFPLMERNILVWVCVNRGAWLISFICSWSFSCYTFPSLSFEG